MNTHSPKTLSELLALYFSKSAPIQPQSLQGGQDPLLPWYVYFLQTLGALAIAGIILGYVDFQFGPRNPILLLGLGILLYAASATLYYLAKAHVAINQLALVISFAALYFVVRGADAYFGYGIEARRYIALVIAGFELLAFFATRDSLRRFLAAIIIAQTALQALLVWEAIPVSVNFPALALALLVFLVWHYYPVLLKAKSGWQAPLRYALVFALLGIVSLVSFYGGIFSFRIGRIEPNQFHVWISTAGIGLALIVTTYVILKRHQVATLGYLLLSVALIAAIGLLTWHTPGILTGLFVITLGFAYGSRVLISFGIAYLVWFVFQYYYNINTDLLMKSIALMGTGAILLATAWYLDKVRRGLGEKDA